MDKEDKQLFNRLKKQGYKVEAPRTLDQIWRESWLSLWFVRFGVWIKKKLKGENRSNGKK